MIPRELILIRHAESELDYTLPAHQWRLSEVGIAQADRLAQADFWPRVDLLFSSDELKSLATARPAAERHGREIHRLRALREVRRPAGRLSDYDRAVCEYLAGRDAGLGWETRVVAERRIWNAVERLLRRHPRATAVLVSHGTVLALYVCRLLEIADRAAVWRGIPFGGYARLDPGARRLLAGFVPPPAALPSGGFL